MRERTSVAVCVATFRRPRGLERTLASIEAQRFEGDRVPDLRVLVVENDPARSCEDAVARIAREMVWPVEYGVESRRGYSYVRNRLVGMAIDAGVDYLAFIDDDEAADSGWMEALLRCAEETGSGVVLGPVLSRFEQPVPGWLLREFERRRHPTGVRVGAREFRTGNVLFRSLVFEDDAEPFSSEYAITGGEDANLGRRLEMAGVEFYWSDEAVVTEDVPPSRASARWVLARRYGVARNLVRIRMSEAPGPRTAITIAGRTAGVIALGELQIAAAPLGGSSRLFGGACNIAWGLGNLRGLVECLLSRRR